MAEAREGEEKGKTRRFHSVGTFSSLTGLSTCSENVLFLKDMEDSYSIWSFKVSPIKDIRISDSEQPFLSCVLHRGVQNVVDAHF